MEVKYRSNEAFGYPAEAVTKIKQRKIYYTAQYYCYKNKIKKKDIGKKIDKEINFRFDVIEILGNKIRWIKDAF